MKINPYLNFDGNCREAFTFYAGLMGGENLVIMTYADMPAPAGDASSETETGCAQGAPQFNPAHVMHARMDVGGIMLMASDSPAGLHQKAQGLYVSVNVTEPSEADRIFKGLAEGGVVSMPIAETFWALRFGMLTDRFGTPWMVNCEKAMG